MKKFKMILMLTFVLITSCDLTNPKTISAEGYIHNLGVTTFQYGDYSLKTINGTVLYVLESAIYDLEKFVGKKVSINGELKDGYEETLGPKFMIVKSLKLIE